MFSCPYCDSTRSSSDGLLGHVKLKHKDLMCLETACTHFDCKKKFVNFHAFKKHSISSHAQSTSIASKPATLSENNQTRDSGMQIDGNFVRPASILTEECKHDDFIPESDLGQGVNDLIAEYEKHCDDIKIFTETAYNYVASIVLKIYADPALARKNVDDVIGILIDFYNSKVMTMILSKCVTKNIDVMTQIINNAFSFFRSEHKAFTFFKERGYLIMPETVTLASLYGSRTKNAECIPTTISDKLQFILMREVLKRYLSMPGVLEKIIKNIERLKRDESFNSVFKSEMYKEIEKRYVGKFFLLLLLYNDDFEINNCLGSHRVISKIGAVYCTFFGLPPEYASQLENIFLFQLHKYVDHRDYGNKIIYKRVIEELTFLQEEGIEVEFKGEILRIYFPLYAVTGDNLALDLNLGFRKGPNTAFPCRLCLAPMALVKKMTQENVELLRDPEKHDEQCSKNEFGLLEVCVFHDVPHYSALTQGVEDAMHDLNEGICRYDMGFILHQLIYVEERFSLDDLQRRILEFNYTHDRNAIPSLSDNQIKKGYLILSASEMAFLVENLTLLVGDRVPKTNRSWKLYLFLREIMSIVYGESFSREVFAKLELLVDQHHKLYKLLTGKELTIKFHNLLHLIRIIMKMGPARLFACLRFEGNHKVFTAYAEANHNRTNPPFSLALKNQLGLAYRLCLNKGLDDRLVTSERSKLVVESSDCFMFNHLISNYALQDYERVASVRTKGTIYKENYVICIKNEQNEPEFGKIKLILVHEMNVIFLFFKLEVKKFNKHLAAYRVEETKDTGIVNQDTLKIFLPQVLHLLPDGHKYVNHRIYHTLN
ncbi:hypothetical protein QAD02_018138 [Eretmocerus hayati]|uniref:Uncharacterized protein n=1 Tax=Eretmocerus hayati TaxID=131215 RepID=A0ACC2PHT4_9HYME|nr:hypothetical protein QAD02_018138 [Eretmocerus hayati]